MVKGIIIALGDAIIIRCTYQIAKPILVDLRTHGSLQFHTHKKSNTSIEIYYKHFENRKMTIHFYEMFVKGNNLAGFRQGKQPRRVFVQVVAVPE